MPNGSGPSRRVVLASIAAAAASQGLGFGRMSPEEDAFLEDISHRSFLFFYENANPDTGLILDRSLADGGAHNKVASIASNAFGLTSYCIAANRNWIPRDVARSRVLTSLRHFAENAPNVRGWFYHFVDASSGQRVWNCELSSIDTALLLAGVLTAAEYFNETPEIRKLSDTIYSRIDFQWMLNGSPTLLSMGWTPERGFLKARWDRQCELGILYLLGIAAPKNPITANCWYSWKRPQVKYAGYQYVSGSPALFVHQYSQAWIDFRRHHDKGPLNTNWFQNSVIATQAHRKFCVDLHDRFPGYTNDVWGITTSDSAHGYVTWGGPPADGPIDGTVVPYAAGGSLMFAPEICLPSLMLMRRTFANRIWKRYGFVDAFHPTNGWTDTDVIGIDQGITLLSAENLRTGNVWQWFMRNRSISAALDAVSA